MASGRDQWVANRQQAQQPLPAGATGELTNYTPSWRDRLADVMASAAHGISGKDYSEARRDSMTLLGLAPGTGQVMAAEDAVREGKAGNWKGAALAGVGALPEIGPEARALATGERAAGRAALTEAKAAPKITAYHGSPHSFDQFDLSKIGTGEGAQAYGHGMYFAENEGVARSYRDNISASQDPLANMNMAIERLNDQYMKKRLTPEMLAEQLATNPNYRSISFLKDDPAALRDFHAIVQGHNPDGTVTDEAIRAMRRIENNPNIPKKSSGHMYEVNINADPAHFLDWDKPMSEQPEAVKAALKAKMDRLQQRGDVMMPSYVEQYEKGTLTGPQVYHGIGGQAEQSTEALQQAGIPGIKYLDAGSRSAGDGSRNYVVFDPKIIEIVRKYGIAGALGAGLISQEMASQMQQQTGGDHAL